VVEEGQLGEWREGEVGMGGTRDRIMKLREVAKREVLVGGPGTSCKLAAAGSSREDGHVK